MGINRLPLTFFNSLVNTTTHLQFSPIRDISITLSYRIKQNRDSILFCDQHLIYRPSKITYILYSIYSIF